MKRYSTDFATIRPGDRVEYRSRHQFLATRANRATAMLVYPSHVTCDAGGRYGRPVVVTRDTYICHRRSA